jgi:hypothetical protein
MLRRDSQRDDYLRRIIRQAAETLRRLRERLTGSAESATAVRDEARAAIPELLGEQSGLLMRLDADTAAHLIGNRERVELWASLVELDADACAAAGDSAGAATNRARAAALRAAANKLKAEPSS